MKPIQDYVYRLSDGILWRWSRLENAVDRRRSGSHPAWVRVEMERATREFVASQDAGSKRVLEVGGENWKSTAFASYLSIDYPEYDLCEGPLERETYDLIFLEQVLEHVLWPHRAVRSLFQMLRPGGWAIVTTPFLVKVHAYPVDCSRWTELGLKHLLAEGGFSIEGIETGSWGNRAAVIRGFRRVPRWIPWWHSLRNEPNYPVMIWAFANKPDSSKATETSL